MQNSKRRRLCVKDAVQRPDQNRRETFSFSMTLTTLQYEVDRRLLRYPEFRFLSKAILRYVEPEDPRLTGGHSR